ncbi:MAG: hypothetical protein CME60_03620 [Halobacteriovoraceae bacterium]|nr:hypothetical protein [Halobacteriovoraceae bacterium]
MDIIKEPHSNYLSHGHYDFSFSKALIWPIFCLLISWYYWSPYSENFRVTHDLIFNQKEIWRLPLGFFVHGDLNHFLSNSLFLTILGYFIGRTYGNKIVFIGGFVIALGTHALTLLFMKDNISLVGASGLLYGFWGLWFSLYFLIDRYISKTRRLMKIVAISLLLLVPHEFEPNVSYLAHGIGFFLGAGFGIIIFLSKRRLFQSYEKFHYSIDPPYNPAFEALGKDFWKKENIDQESLEDENAKLS